MGPRLREDDVVVVIYKKTARACALTVFVAGAYADD